MRGRVSKLLLIFVSLGLTVFGTGCQTREAILIPPIVWVEGKPSDLIMLGPDVKGTIYVRIDGKWVRSDNEVQIPEGWLAGPPPPKEDK